MAPRERDGARGDVGGCFCGDGCGGGTSALVLRDWGGIRMNGIWAVRC